MVGWTGSEGEETCCQTGIISPDSIQPRSSGSIVLRGDHRCEILHQVWRTCRGFLSIHSETEIGRVGFIQSPVFSSSVLQPL